MGKSLHQTHAVERARLNAVQVAERRSIDTVRGRYRWAIAQGMSKEAAADYAHDRMKTKRKKDDNDDG